MARASGHGPDEAVEVAALELVGLGGQRAEVGDAVVARAGGEHLVERERGQRGEAAGRAAADAQPVGVDVAALDEVARTPPRSPRRRRRPTAPWSRSR